MGQVEPDTSSDLDHHGRRRAGSSRLFHRATVPLLAHLPCPVATWPQACPRTQRLTFSRCGRRHGCSNTGRRHPQDCANNTGGTHIRRTDCEGPPAKSHQLSSVLGHRGRFIAKTQPIPSWPGWSASWGNLESSWQTEAALGDGGWPFPSCLCLGLTCSP